MCEFFRVAVIYIVYLRAVSGSGCLSWFGAVSRKKKKFSSLFIFFNLFLFFVTVGERSERTQRPRVEDKLSRRGYMF